MACGEAAVQVGEGLGVAGHGARHPIARASARPALAAAARGADDLERRIHIAVHQRNLDRARHLWPHLPEAA
jgi:hypothetical protein